MHSTHRSRFPLPLLVLLAAIVAACFCRPAAAEPGDELTVSVLTFGPGDHPFFKFGHNAVLVHDASRTGPAADLVYNYGTFDFAAPGLFFDFFKGKLRYWLSVQPFSRTIAHYRAENRTIEKQELALTPRERREFVDRLEWNATPEHRYYTYDYYRDNCSTRIRDLVDRVTGGRLAAVSRAPAEYTWREHTLRLTADALPVFFGLDAALGHPVDRRVTQWEEMFLPAKLEESLRRVQVPGPNGDRPLVASERLVLPARNRAALRAAPPGRTSSFLLAGGAVGALFALLGFGAARSRAARLALSVALSVTGLVVGLFGALLASFWLFTDHAVAYRNENVLQFPPFVLALTVAGAGVASANERWRKGAYHLCLAAALVSAAGLVAKLLPSFDQSNGQIVALMLPVWIGTALATRFATAPAAVAERDGGDGRGGAPRAESTAF